DRPGDNASAPRADTATRRDAAGEPVAGRVDPLRIELGFALVRLAEDDRLLDRVAAIRAEIGEELGLLAPRVRVRDDLRLGAHEYRIRVRDAVVAGGTLYAGRLLAVPGEHAAGKLEGREGTDPIFDIPSVWIEPARADRATRMGYRTVPAVDVLMAHLGKVIRARAAELLSREQVAGMLSSLEGEHPHLVAEVRRKLSLGRVQQILRRLLGEAAPIRDLEGILEAATDAAERTDRIDEITEQVRSALTGTLGQHYASSDGRLWCVRLKPELENAIHAHLHETSEGPATTLPPALAEGITDAVAAELTRIRRRGRRPVVLCAAPLRPALRKLIAPADADTAVLAYDEVDRASVESAVTVAAGTPRQTHRAES
ncbi:MAG: FHIPEP family type III secretion protein, partial [Planctomycetota bacterium]